MYFTPTRQAVDALLRDLGSSCKVDKTDGTSASAVGVILSAQTKAGPDANSFISSTEKVCYLPAKISVIPETGDTVTFKPNTYAIKEVRAIAVGEGSKNVFAYRLVVGA